MRMEKLRTKTPEMARKEVCQQRTEITRGAVDQFLGLTAKLLLRRGLRTPKKEGGEAV